MNILILGIDGYIGYPLAIDLLKKGHTVTGLDNHSRRCRAPHSLTTIASPGDRDKYLRSFPNYHGTACVSLGLANPTYLQRVLSEEKPDAIIHLAEQPSAAWSMKDPFNASDTQLENVIGTLHLLWCIKNECPNTHLIKLGTMGEYGTPNCDIPEGKIDYQCAAGIIDYHGEIEPCPMAGLLFPRTPGSFYHASKVMDTVNIEFCCRNWGLTSTDIMQGVVYGLISTTPNEITRFDYDECFGTAINRFCVQALAGHPLTVYGSGNQTRGWLPLKDSIQCINLILNNPPEPGEYRTINQFEQLFSVSELARIVMVEANDLGIESSVASIPNPRKEAEQHYYNPDHSTLKALGYNPKSFIPDEIGKLLNDLMPFKHLIKPELIQPKINWE